MRSAIKYGLMSLSALVSAEQVINYNAAAFLQEDTDAPLRLEAMDVEPQQLAGTACQYVENGYWYQLATTSPYMNSATNALFPHETIYYSYCNELGNVDSFNALSTGCPTNIYAVLYNSSTGQCSNLSGSNFPTGGYASNDENSLQLSYSDDGSTTDLVVSVQCGS